MSTHYQDLINYLNHKSFVIDDVQLDSRVHRFDRQGKKNAWYIGFQNHTLKSGEPFIVCVFGDWRTGEEHKFVGNVKLSKADQKAIDDTIKQSMAEQEKYKKELQKRVAKEIKEYINDCCVEWGHVDYLEKKRIERHNAKTCMTENGRALAVPMRDIDNEIWGLQKIYDTSDKFFWPGQRLSGLFYLFGSFKAKTIYLCEGFATGATVYEQLKVPVVSCFTAHNLKTVCKELRKKYPNKTLVVLADNDRFTEGNPGETLAREACENVIVPEFKDSPEGTDFNDLFLQFGFDELKNQIIGVETQKNYVNALGHHGSTYYYQSSDNKQIVQIAKGSHNKLHLLDLMPLPYWETLYPKKNGIDWDLAANDLMAMCRKQGLFDSTKIRGSGVWLDDKRVVCNTGQYLICYGRKYDYNEFESDYIYSAGQTIFKKEWIKKLNKVDKKLIVDLCKSLKFKQPTDYILFLGWLVLAPICGAVPWRPHMWLTGSAGTGKSTIMNEIASRLLKGYTLPAQGKSSEAGLRQALRADAIPITFDEFETDSKLAAERVQSILELMRQASTESNKKIYTGTTHGVALLYQQRFMALTASIRVSLSQQSDYSRFCVLELKPNKAGLPELQSKIAQIRDDIHHAWFSNSLKHAYDIKESMESCFKSMCEQFPARVAQQYGYLIGAYCWLTGEPQEPVLSQFGYLLEDTEVEADSETCLDYLMQSIVTLENRSQATIGEIVQKCMNYNPAIDSNPFSELHRRGMHYNKETKKLFVRQIKHAELQKIFRDTEWHNSWGNALRQIDGARYNRACQIAGRIIKCVEVDLSRYFVC